MAELTQEDVQTILKIIDEMGDRDIHLEIGELKLHVTRGGDAAHALTLPSPPAPTAAPVQPAKTAVPAPRRASSEVPAGHAAVRAPTIGIFYRAASPGAQPYVEIGDRVGPEDTVCMFEVMKLFSSLKAGVAGAVVAILVANESLVAQDQPLILIKPD